MKKINGKDLAKVTKREAAVQTPKKDEQSGVDAVVVAAVASSVMKMADAVKRIGDVQAKQSSDLGEHIGRKRRAVFTINRDPRGLLKSVVMEEK